MWTVPAHVGILIPDLRENFSQVYSRIKYSKYLEYDMYIPVVGKVSINGMPDLPAVGESDTGRKIKITIPEPVRYRKRATQSGIFFVLVRYQTETMDNGIPSRR
jgi:hypothetical protein